MNNQSKNLAHFTSLSKKPLSSNLNFKYPTSLPSPKDSSNKIISNLNSFNSNGEIIMIKKKFLNKSKETESKSSYINFASPLSKYYKSNLKKTLTVMAYILNSVDYKDSLLDSLVGEGALNYNEETFNIYKTTGNDGSNFLDIIEQYDDGRVNSKDEDVLDIKQNLE